MFTSQFLTGRPFQRVMGIKVTDISAAHLVLLQWRSWLLELPRVNKRVILATLDFVLLSFALWFSISFRYSTFYVPSSWEAFAKRW